MGADRLADLAEQIKSYQDVLESFFVFFIFDHDEKGIDACNRVRSLGYRLNQHTTTLNPQKPLEKANFSVKHERVIEDLLSLEIQQNFFDTCPSRNCKVTYQDGKIVRFQWDGSSKKELQSFACQRGSLDHFMEHVRLLRRVRSAFGLPLQVPS